MSSVRRVRLCGVRVWAVGCEVGWERVLRLVAVIAAMGSGCGIVAIYSAWHCKKEFSRSRLEVVCGIRDV